MANRYWVGGTDNWNATAGTKWATTSGGAGGSAVPTSADDVFFDVASGAVTVTIATVDANCLSLNCTGFTGTLTGSAVGLGVYGNITLGSGMTNTFTNNIFMQGAASSFTLTTNGIAIDRLQFVDTNHIVTLQDNLTILTNLIVNDGTFDANDFNVTVTNFSASTSTGTLIAGNGTWDVKDWSAASLGTFTCEGSTIKLTETANTNKTFAGNGKTYNVVWFNRGTSTGINTISGSNTFTTLKDTGTVAHTTRFTTGTSQTISIASGWQISGSSGNLITITSTTTGTHSLNCSSGNISADYLAIAHSVAGGGATWYAGANSTNNQATATAGSGWIFTAPPVAANGNMLAVF